MCHARNFFKNVKQQQQPQLYRLSV